MSERVLPRPHEAGSANTPPTMLVKDRRFYDLLGVAPNADALAIRKAYRKRALQLHPDKRPLDAETVWHMCFCGKTSPP